MDRSFAKELILSQPLVVALVAVAVAGVVFYHATQRTITGLPPGPKPSFWGTPIPKHPWLYYHELSKKYKSALVTVWVGFTPYIVVTTAKAAHQVMEKESNKTSGRPYSVTAQVLTGGLRIGVTTYNDRWRKLRKALHVNLTPNFAKTYEPRQTQAGDQLLKDILKDPENYREHLRTFAVTVIMAATYGRTGATSYQDPDIRRVVAGLDRYGAAMVPGAYKVDYLPWLRFVPGYLSAPHKHHLEELGVYSDMFNEVRDKMKAGTAEACFVAYIVERQKTLGLSDSEAYYLAGSLFTGGADTTVSSSSTILLAAVAFPDKLKVVQDELDRVVGPDRAPLFSDKEDLPELQAFVQEALRWRPVLPSALPHSVTETFTYDGYVLPKGAIIAGNIWSIHRDPEIFEDGDAFIPERWLHTVDGVKSMNPAVNSSQFGFGRRVCPGQHVGDRSVFISTAKLLWAFNVTRKKDSDGKELPLNLDPNQYVNAAVTHSLPFPATLTPRSPSTTKIIQGLDGMAS